MPDLDGATQCPVRYAACAPGSTLRASLPTNSTWARQSDRTCCLANGGESGQQKVDLPLRLDDLVRRHNYRAHIGEAMIESQEHSPMREYGLASPNEATEQLSIGNAMLA